MTTATLNTNPATDFSWGEDQDLPTTNTAKVVPINQPSADQNTNHVAETPVVAATAPVLPAEIPQSTVTVHPENTVPATVVAITAVPSEANANSDEEAEPTEDINDALTKLQLARQAAQKKLDDKFMEKEFNLRRKAMGASARKNIALDAMELMRQTVREHTNEPYSDDTAVDELIKKVFQAGLSSIGNVPPAI